MSGSTITAYLRRLCRDMDRGRPLQPFPWRKVLAPLAVPVVMGLSLGAVGCEEAVTGTPALEYAAPMPDRVQPLPAPTDPAGPEPVPVTVYGAPPPEVGDGGPTEAHDDAAVAPGSDAAPAEAGTPSGDGGAAAQPAKVRPSGRRRIGKVKMREVTVLYGAPFE